MPKMSHPSSNSFLDEDSFFSDMLSSQSDLEEQISHLKDIIEDDDRNVEDKLTELQNFLESSNIKNAPIDILDEKIFNVVLSYAQKIYLEVIENINHTLKNKQDKDIEDVRSQLNILINSLKCWDSCISHIKSLEKVSVIDIKSFPENLFDVVSSILNHCKNSIKNYGDYFQSVSESLTSLFRQSVNTLNSFYVLMDSVITFDTNEENAMNILIKIIDETGKLATLSSGMDAKTLTDTWKRFGKLSTNYAIDMKGKSPSTVTCHFKGLSESIVTVLSSVDKKSQRTSNERSILCSRLLLKILEKLCETYCGWIRNNVMFEIVSMLTKLYRYTETCLKFSGYKADFIKFITTNLAFMIEPFLDIVFKNDSFRVAFFEYGKNINEDAIGYHLLLLTVVKKISLMPYETQQEWCNKENCILNICFQNIDRLAKHISLGKLQIQMSRDVTQGSYLANIYEATCLSIFTLVCQTPDSDFSELVTLLLKHLLSGQFFSSLLSSDVWCFLCRLGSSEMCYNNFKYLMKVYEILEKRTNHFNIVILSNLLSRQYTFLLDKDKIDFINSITKTSNPHRWKSIARTMDSQKKNQLQQQIDIFSVTTQISNDLKSLEEQPSLNTFLSLVKNLSIIEATDMPEDEQSIVTFIKMWNKIVRILGDCEGTLLLLLEELTAALMRATHVKGSHTKYMTTIFELMNSLYPYASSSLHYEFCRFFDRSAVQLIECVSHLVAELFCCLLCDKDPCVKQQAFESFDHLTRACPNADLLSSVALSLRNAQSELSKTLPAYISGEVAHTFMSFANIDEFFEAVCAEVEKNTRHVCYKRSQADREEKLMKLDEEAEDSKGGSEDAEMRAERVCVDMELVLKYKGQMKRDIRDKLSLLCQKFLDDR